MKLNKIGRKYHNDKVDIHHQFKDESYLDVYETYFKKFEHEPVRFLELGVRDGSSFRVWNDYFTNENKVLIGVDIQNHCKQYEGGCVKVEIGSQADPKLMKSIIDKYGPFHIILDDASHINDLSIASFELLQHAVIPGGYYIIEDLRNSYEDLTEAAMQWPGMHDCLNAHTNSVSFNNAATRPKLDALFQQIIRDLDYRLSDFRSVHFHSQLVVLEK
jgi:hypothetical protein